MNKKTVLITTVVIVVMVFLSASVFPGGTGVYYVDPNYTPGPDMPQWRPLVPLFHPNCWYAMNCKNPAGWTNRK